MIAAYRTINLLIWKYRNESEGRRYEKENNDQEHKYPAWSSEAGGQKGLGISPDNGSQKI